MEWIKSSDKLPSVNIDVLVTNGETIWTGFINDKLKWENYELCGEMPQSSYIFWIPMIDLPKD